MTIFFTMEHGEVRPRNIQGLLALLWLMLKITKQTNEKLTAKRGQQRNGLILVTIDATKKKENVNLRLTRV